MQRMLIESTNDALIKQLLLLTWLSKGKKQPHTEHAKKVLLLPTKKSDKTKGVPYEDTYTLNEVYSKVVV